MGLFGPSKKSKKNPKDRKPPGAPKHAPEYDRRYRCQGPIRPHGWSWSNKEPRDVE